MSKPNRGKDDSDEARSEHRVIVARYNSVEFSLDNLVPSYVFKVRDLSSSGLGVLVKENSQVLAHIKVGDILSLKYHGSGEETTVDHYKTEIRHITEDDKRFPGHRLVGLSILERLEDHA